MYKITGVRSWNLNADNLDETVRFYRELLGGEERVRHTVAGANVVRMRVEDFGLGLFDGSDGPRPGVPHHTFEIEGPEDPQELVREIEAKGFKSEDVRQHRDGQGYSVYVTDPSGNRIELSCGEG